ncbi:serine hydrolase domain-containing protein [Algoriphagus litoralis]|uniref:serine hydrolase domain-containing protein n=1 Tax=Algoriphagus litoralis TaxID=2202829 RepID=UPI000DBA43A8|nr:serine hydrolase domain-containing protein [Algoriphagus litoralis]
MKRFSKYLLTALAFWLLLFLGWEWWYSFPKVRWTPISFPQTQEEKIDSVLVQSLSEYLIPGMAAGIIEEGKVTYLKAFGFENLETKDSLTLQSLIPVASVSKIFTALTLANYGLEKGIGIDTPVNSLLPTGKKLSSEYDHITLQQLLTHTSGLSDRRGIGTIWRGNAQRDLSNLPSQLNLPNLQQREFKYADANFDLIGYLVETIENQPFEVISQSRILTVGGMENGEYVTQWPLDSLAISGYQRTLVWKRIEEKALVLERFPSPSSGLVLSSADLAKILLHLSREEMGIFGDELDWLKGKTDTPAGFQSIVINDIAFIGHFGGQGGHSSLVIFSPELDLAFFLVSNAQDKSDFRKAVAGEVLKIKSK